ncbi:MAG: HEAT repeat domain-containing protein [Planctomycetes bacterium]|nr:HEAT repeat domain-containing protein [Planctomycetota bacterium]
MSVPTTPRTPLSWHLVLATALLAPCMARGDDPAAKARRAIADFRAGFKPEKSYMRPLGDEGWKARFTALADLVASGAASTPTLLEALGEEDPELRVFSAQALSVTADPHALPRLLEAVEKDPEPAVRLYAADALGTLDGAGARQALEKSKAEDKNGDVRAHAGFALERKGREALEEVRKALEGFDPKRLAAARLGEPAPDFTLRSHDGAEVELRSFRGKKTVILVFIYGDT